MMMLQEDDLGKPGLSSCFSEDKRKVLFALFLKSWPWKNLRDFGNPWGCHKQNYNNRLFFFKRVHKETKHTSENGDSSTWTSCTCTLFSSKQRIIELFFVKKYLLVRASGMLWAGGSVDRWEMYVCHANHIGCTFKHQSNWYVRRSDPDTVENGHIYSSVKEEEIFIYWVYLDIFCGLGWGFCGRVWYH